MGRAPMRLNEADRTRVEAFLQRGKANARTLTRARMLLKSDAGWTDARIAADLNITEQTIRNVRQRFRAGGIEAVLADKRPTRQQQALQEAQAANRAVPSPVSILAGWLQNGLQRWQLGQQGRTKR